MIRLRYAAAAISLLVIAAPALAALPPVPTPPENPTTEAKRVLGKALFWDEQLSSDSTVACGSCHQPRAGGADPRRVRGPGHDGKLGTDDDIFGSPGVVTLNRKGGFVHDPVFGDGFRVGARSAQSNFGGLWASANFWDGRAGTTFKDPVSGKVMIAKGGALENQAIGPLMNDAEMAHQERAWPEILRALKQAKPLALARKLPPDLKPLAGADYPTLFEKAFGDPEITPARIAFAIAAYQRTLIPDQSPWDLAAAGKAPLPEEAQAGKAWFEYHRCDACHKPPLFSDDRFVNIGVREGFEDAAHAQVSGDKRDEGRVKVPTLRNVMLKSSFTHTGELTSLDEVLELYERPRAPRDKLPDGTDYTVRLGQPARVGIKAFISALTDPRVAEERFPFDRPELRSEWGKGDTFVPAAPTGFKADSGPQGGSLLLSWTPPMGAVTDYVVSRDGEVIGLPTVASFVDEGAGAAGIHVYRVAARGPSAKASPAALTLGFGPFGWVWPAGVLALAGAGVFFLRRRRKPVVASPAAAE